MKQIQIFVVAKLNLCQYVLLSVLFLMIVSSSSLVYADIDTDASSKLKNIVQPKPLDELTGNLPIDLVKHSFYVRQGFSHSWILQWPGEFPAEERKAWTMVAGKSSGGRSIRLQDVAVMGANKEFKFFENYHETFTLVTKFFVSKSLYQSHHNLGLHLAGIGENYEIFINGKSIYKEIHLDDEGKIALSKIRRNLVVPINAKVLQQGDNILSFKILGNPHDGNVGLFFNYPYKIDHLSNIKKTVSEQLPLILITLYLFVGLYHILLFVRRPKDGYNLYFGLFSIGLFLYLFTRSNAVYDVIADSRTIIKLELAILFIFPYALIQFTDTILLGSGKIIGKIYLAMAGVFSLLAAVLPIHVSGQYILITWQMIMPFVLAYLLYRVLRANIRNIRKLYQAGVDNKGPKKFARAMGQNLFNHVSGNILMGYVVLAFTSVYDVLDSIFWHTGIALTKYGFFLFVMGIAVSLANRFLSVHQQVEELNSTLEKKVEDRTKRLKDSLFRVQQLKEQQDGDYFLTSLLTEPLNANNAANQQILVDFYVKEKKEFQFRKWKREIGGDMCMAHSLNLRGKNYTMFINADAMGKSIQGAGGILVLGSVLNSLIERTLVSPVDNNLFPERWIRNAFVELQKIFEGFNGSMLISAVLGLVDEQSGLMYFINAEHPWTILYREKKSRFIEDELTFHKLGTQGVDSQLWVQTFQMEHGDVILMGSDGRDDILLGMDPKTGERIINEDENLILSIVSETDGDIKAIAKKILTIGELTDDLSLLRIRYNASQNDESQSLDPQEEQSVALAKQKMLDNQFKEVIQLLEEVHIKHPQNLAILAMLIKSCLSEKKYDKVLHYSEKYYRIEPENSQYIYLASLAAKKVKDFGLAADLGERFRLRDPNNIRNLTNLSDIYRLAGNHQRARKMAENIMDLSPDNKNAKKILEALPV